MLTLLCQRAQRLGDVGVVPKGAPHLRLQHRACIGLEGGGSRSQEVRGVGRGGISRD